MRHFSNGKNYIMLMESSVQVAFFVQSDMAMVTGNNVIRQLEKIFSDQKEKVFLLTDTNTSKFCLPVLRKKIPAARKAVVIKINAGERNKNIDACHHIWKKLIEHRATRQSVLINLGGGTVCDIGGFAASVFKRGIKFYNVPTTILSMADASIGGKTGIDYDGIKNVIGVFKPAEEIFVIPEFQKSLPVREWRSGFAEITKSALIADKRLWKELQQLKEGSYLKEDFIRRCAELKQSIVKQDPYEKNVRRLLNFGHTIGHPFESYSHRHHRHPITHGEAVAAGMICATYLSQKKVKLSNEEAEKIISFLTSRYGRFKPASYPADKIIEAAKQDKKITGKDFNFTLVKKIGVGLIDCPCSEKEMRWALQQYFSR